MRVCVRDRWLLPEAMPGCGIEKTLAGLESNLCESSGPFQCYLCGHRSSKHRQELLPLSHQTTSRCPSSCCALGASCLSALTAARGYQAAVQLKASPSAAGAGEWVALGLCAAVGLLSATIVGGSSTGTGKQQRIFD